MKRSIVGIIFVVLCCIALVGTGYAVTYVGHDYQLTSPGLTWLQAEAEAVAAGGHLVTINSEAEEDWLLANFNTRFWIGFTDQAVEGTFAWISGEAITYTNWNSGEPNNAGGSEDYTEMTNLSNWNDLPWTSVIPGIIEKVIGGGPGPIPTPEPTTMLLLGLGLMGLAGVRRKIQK